MARNDAVIRFSDVSYEYSHIKPILNAANFAVRRGAKMALMGQNGAGKSTIFGLITGALEQNSGDINLMHGQSIALGRQVIPRDELDLTVRDFFQRRFKETIYNIDPRIDKVLEVVNLKAPHDRIVRSFSGGQQARLLLASALIEEPDILLLDEPTNNLDHAGIKHLTEYLKAYKKTCLVISHDAEFLNAFTHGVLYLDVFTHTVEQYDGNYHDVVEEISRRIEREQLENVRLQKEISKNMEQANVFAHKGGNMRLVAKRMREKAEAAEESMVDVRREDKTIRSFKIPSQHVPGEVLHISSYKVIKDHKASVKKTDISLRRHMHLQLVGPNGIGKSTLLESIVNGTAEGMKTADGVKVGYYRQDFSTLTYSDTVYESLMSVMEKKIEADMRSVAAGFLLTSDIMDTKIGMISEGQKGLVVFAQLVLMKPGLLILDEPTNHINFRHIPEIAKALNAYDGAMILVSHVPEFVKEIRIDHILDLGR